jgi:hypothetical protein
MLPSVESNDCQLKVTFLLAISWEFKLAIPLPRTVFAAALNARPTFALPESMEE